MVRNEEWLEALVEGAMAEVQRNAVPVIKSLIAAAQDSRPPVCTFDEGCESCQ